MTPILPSPGGVRGQTRVVLVIMSGLPGVGKSAIADELGRALPACVVSVDPIEAAMLESGIAQSFETGLAAYNVGAAIAAHQLRLGMSVVADAANSLEVGRRIWTSAADAAGVATFPIEIVCGDEAGTPAPTRTPAPRPGALPCTDVGRGAPAPS